MSKAPIALLLVALALLVGLVACDHNAQARPRLGAKGDQKVANTKQATLSLELSSGQAPTEASVTQPKAKTTPLDSASTATLLKRLPAMPSAEGLQKDFAKRPETLPAPRTGETVSVPFPAPEDLKPPTPPQEDTIDQGKLSVLRYAPEGDVPMAPQVSVTFSHPMIALDSQTGASQNVPVKLEPQPEGSWRWLGTKTIIFDPKAQRLPMATSYKVTIAKGTKSINGLVLDEEVSFSFKTPTLNLLSVSPSGTSTPLDPLILLSFNQAIDSSKILPFVTLQTEGSKELPFRLATEKELQADSRAQAQMEDKPANRFLAIKPNGDLPKNTKIFAGIKKGTPSAEGPLTTGSVQTRSFTTYGPFRLDHAECGWRDEPAPPGTPWRIYFTNEVDDDSFDPSAQITVTPELEGMRVSCGGSCITITGNSKGRTSYKVTFDKSLGDVFGQDLEKDATCSFEMGSATPSIQTVGGSLVVLDPQGPRSYSLYTINEPKLDVSIFAVKPEDYPQFLEWRSEQMSWRVRNGREKAKLQRPGREVFSGTINTDKVKDAFVETRIDLSKALNKDGLGQAFVVIRTRHRDKDDDETIITWIQATRIGLSAYADSETMTAWATELSTGKPLTDATINGKKTNDQGILYIKGHCDDNMIIAKRGEDTAFLHSVNSLFSTKEHDRFKWYTFSDRGIYKPKEKACFKGWLREMTAGPEGDIVPVTSKVRSIEWSVSDSRGNEFAKGQSELSPYGGFDLSVTIPDNVNLGKARLKVRAVLNDASADKVSAGRFSSNNAKDELTFDIQEFRTPEFEVQTKNEQSVSLLGEVSKVSATANYYAGGSLSRAKTHWNVTATPGSYSPPGWDKYIFGVWRPWWSCYWLPSPSGEAVKEEFDGVTDSNGKHTLSMNFISSNEEDRAPIAPTAVTVSAAISDLNEQTWSSKTNLLVHPSELYVGIKPAKQFVERQVPINLECIVTDIDGKAKSGTEIKLRSACISSEYRHGKTIEIEEDIQEQTLKSGSDAIKAQINPKQGGHYRITAEVSDSKGRRNRTQLIIWVAGGPQVKSRKVEQEHIELVPDKQEYKVGETAEILVVSPFFPAEGIYTLNRSGVVSSERFTMKDSSYTIKVPIKESYIPNLHLQVELLGKQERINDDGTPAKDTAARPAYASGHLSLSIPAYERTLKLEVNPASKKLAPGSDTAVEVTLKDSQGQPVADSEVALVAVDEAVLALIGYKIPSPIGILYTARGNQFSSRDLRSLVQLCDPGELEPANAPPQEVCRMVVRDEDNVCYESAPAMAGGAMMNAMGAAPRMLMKSAAAPVPKAASVDTSGGAIAMRSNFDPQALWVASVHTDAQGRARTSFHLPDNLTRYRITAVAADRNHKFGYGESSLTACLPVMVRPSLPRFLNFGDNADLPVLVQNQTDKPINVCIAARAQNLTISEPAGQTFSVPANDRLEVTFPAKTQEAGKARVQFAITAGDFSDAAEVTIPVWTPCTSEAFATYGQIDKGAIKQPVKYPQDVWPQFGNLEITTSSTAVQELTDAFISLQSYPFSCSEQISSRIMTAVALKDVLTAFKADGMPTPHEMQAKQNEDIEILLRRQEYNGGFRTWDDSEKVYPYITLHTTRALLYAQKAGYGQTRKVDKAVEKALEYVSNIERYINERYYSERERRFLRAYAVDILREAGKANADKAKAILSGYKLDDLSLDTIGFVIPTLSDAAAKDAQAKNYIEQIRRLLNNRVSETAGAACFTDSYSDNNYLLLGSDRRTDGILLRAMIIDQPKSDLIPKLVRGLLAHRKRGSWSNTQENAFILIALNDYFNTYESVTPNFVANIWLGSDYAGKHTYKGRTTEYQETKVPMRYLSEHPATDLIMAKEGEGRLYYRLGLKYAPKSLKLDPMDCGFEVVRTYEGADNPDDVKRLSDGTWQIKLGSRVLCKASMTVPSRRYHVALINPMPAGLEALNPALRVTEELPDTKETIERDTPFWWWGPWYEHANLRDERAEAFSTLVPCGVYEYNFVARATTEGTFIVPPAKAEEMYSPEVFGRSASDKVVVVP